MSTESQPHLYEISGRGKRREGYRSAGATFFEITSTRKLFIVYYWTNHAGISFKGQSLYVDMLFVSLLKARTGVRNWVVNIFNRSSVKTEAPPRPGGTGTQT